VGSRSKIDLAYIAGFLDGDGSLMLQLKKRKDTKVGLRFMTTICFYQDTRHDKNLSWIKGVLGIGYLFRRKDGMTELRINGFKQVENILLDLKPFIKFKQPQAEAMISASSILTNAKFKKLSKKQLIELVDLMLVIQKENYVTKRKKTRQELFNFLGLTP